MCNSFIIFLGETTVFNQDVKHLSIYTNSHLDITVILASDMLTKDTFVPCSSWDINFTDDGTNIRYQGDRTKYC